MNLEKKYVHVVYVTQGKYKSTIKILENATNYGIIELYVDQHEFIGLNERTIDKLTMLGDIVHVYIKKQNKYVLDKITKTNQLPVRHMRDQILFITVICFLVFIILSIFLILYFSNHYAKELSHRYIFKNERKSNNPVSLKSFKHIL